MRSWPFKDAIVFPSAASAVRNAVAQSSLMWKRTPRKFQGPERASNVREAESDGGRPECLGVHFLGLRGRARWRLARAHAKKISSKGQDEMLLKWNIG